LTGETRTRRPSGGRPFRLTGDFQPGRPDRLNAPQIRRSGQAPVAGGRTLHSQAQELIERLSLEKHPEGGYFRETFRSSARVSNDRGFGRAAATSIYFLVTSDSFSAFHRLAADEIWHYYRGGALAVEVIDPQGRHERRVLGGAGPWQTALPARVWFAAHVLDANGYALVGCDVAPGFQFDDFELARYADLAALFPQHERVIAEWTRS
jgi:predicted cupin superfamily sugar epimerase